MPTRVTEKFKKDFSKERINFRSLILANPNHFGNLELSPFKPVLQFQTNSFYEEIGCVGYQPQFRRLDAVIFVNQSSGYSGGLCSNGSREYVRFYISYDDGASWEDEGLASFNVHDIPQSATGGKRLEYALTKVINPKRKFCFSDNVILARAILSWDVPPPADMPHYKPIWGDVHTTHIQVEPRKLIIIGDLFQELEIKKIPILDQIIDLNQEIPAAQKALSLPERMRLYADKRVEAHRFALPELMEVAQKSLHSVQNIQAHNHVGLLKEGILENLEIDLSQIIDIIINPKDGNTSYEELDCVGLNPNQDSLVGVIRIKKPFGYSGGLCSAGSREYVTFWADTNNNGFFETYLGTSSVSVHDIKETEKNELEYSVFLPVDLEKYRQPCDKGARIIPIRAILSWNVPAPANNPNYVPVWGNREETIILVNPGKTVDGQFPILSAVGDMATSIIDNNGKATGVGNLTGFVASDSPFGGMINLCGKIANGTSSSKYRVMKKLHGAPDSQYQPIINTPLLVTLVEFNGMILTITPNFPVTADANGYYAYQDYSSNHYVEGNLLVRWYSTIAEHNQKFDIRVDLSVDGNPANDIHGDVVTVLVDNEAPEVDLTIDLGVNGECADFNKGDVFTGTFKAKDAYFYSYHFEVQPSGPALGAHPVPSSGTSVYYGGTVSDPGVSAGTYSFDTSPMKPCGYSLTLHAYGRANVNSGTTRHHNSKAVGFCVRVK